MDESNKFNISHLRFLSFKTLMKSGRSIEKSGYPNGTYKILEIDHNANNTKCGKQKIFI